MRRLRTTVSIRCAYDTRVVVRNTPSGKTYDFAPGQVLPVRVEDKEHLLAMVKQAGGCCGGNAQARKYFEEV